MKRLLNKNFYCFLVCVILATTGFSQSSGSGISGFVYLDDNQPAEGATINAINTATGFRALAATDKKGYFVLRDLPVGIYTIEISSVNYQPQILKDNALNLGDRLVLRKIVLGKKSAELAEVKVTSNSFNNSIDRLGTSTEIGRASCRERV